MSIATVYEIDPRTGTILRVYRTELGNAGEAPCSNAVIVGNQAKTHEDEIANNGHMVQVVPDGGEGYLRYMRLLNGGRPENDTQRT